MQYVIIQMTEHIWATINAVLHKMFYNEPDLAGTVFQTTLYISY